MARGPRYVDFGAIHRDRQRRRDAKASGHLGNVGQDEFTADGLVKAAPRPPKRHTMASSPTTFAIAPTTTLADP